MEETKEGEIVLRLEPQDLEEQPILKTESAEVDTVDHELEPDEANKNSNDTVTDDDEGDAQNEIAEEAVEAGSSSAGGKEGVHWEMKGGTQQELETDPYFYTRRDEFTSEVYKIEIGGLPLRFGYAQLKKLLNQTLNLNSHKIKAMGSRSTWAYVTFKSEKDREKAMNALAGYKWKGRVLTVKRANPAADPLIRKRVNRIEVEGNVAPDSKKMKIDDENFPIDVRVKNAVMPLWKIPYEEQLKNKEDELKKILVKIGRQIERVCCLAPEWLQRNRSKNNFMCCPLEGLKGSPSIEGYRNKCEFTVGWDPPGREKTVGFRLARYSQGSMCVADPSECTIVPKSILNVCEAFQNYVRQSSMEPYDQEKHEGYWRQLTVRATRSGDVLAVVVVHPQELAKAAIEELKTELKEYFFDGAGKWCHVTALYFQAFAKSRMLSKAGGEPQFEHIHGEEHIKEIVSGMTFRISPNAFFQINTFATEELYNLVGEIANVDSSTVLIDICCGTGTIGLSLAKKVKKVIGIEMITNAVEDARHNAEENNITNADYRCGRVEHVLPGVLYRLSSEDNIIAIVDPPRAGLHTKVIRTIRACKSLHRLVYVSCDPTAATINFVDLCRPESNQYRETPFAIRKAVGVDLFPHANHCELIVLLERDETRAP